LENEHAVKDRAVCGGRGGGGGGDARVEREKHRLVVGLLIKHRKRAACCVK
jgi:hypothetical protein